MKLNRPKKVTWWIAVILGVIGLLNHLGVISIFSGYTFWFVFIGFALLVLATLFKNL